MSMPASGTRLFENSVGNKWIYYMTVETVTVVRRMEFELGLVVHVVPIFLRGSSSIMDFVAIPGTEMQLIFHMLCIT